MDYLAEGKKVNFYGIGHFELKAEDLIRMNTNISLADRDGKFIEVKVPEPEYMPDSIN